MVQWRADRPALVLSSCSWTPDDDFTMMIDALDIYNQQAEKFDCQLPHLIFAVTGTIFCGDFLIPLLVCHCFAMHMLACFSFDATP